MIKNGIKALVAIAHEEEPRRSASRGDKVRERVVFKNEHDRKRVLDKKETKTDL